MEQGPVLILTFTAQQIMCTVDSKGKIVGGGEVCDTRIIVVLSMFVNNLMCIGYSIM